MSTNQEKDVTEELHRTIAAIVNEHISHGFGDLSIGTETIKGKKIAVTVKAGKKYRFILAKKKSSSQS